MGKGNNYGKKLSGFELMERKKAEEELKESQRYTRALIEACLDPLVTISPEGRITDVNHATELVTGNPREKLIGSDFSGYFTDPQKARQGYKQVFKEGYVRDYPLEIEHRDGKVTPVLYNASVYYDAKGAVAGVFAAARDITERKKAEELLRNAEEDWRNSFNALEDVMLIIDKDHNIENINDRGLALIGKSKEEVIGKKCYEIIHGKEKPVEDCPHLKSLKTKKVESLDRFEKGVECYFSIKSSPIFDEHGEIVRFVDLLRDITEHKRVEQELKQKHEERRKFNTLAVGREWKMIELKEEINALLQELGKEPRYRIAGENKKG